MIARLDLHILNEKLGKVSIMCTEILWRQNCEASDKTKVRLGIMERVLLVEAAEKLNAALTECKDDGY